MTENHDAERMFSEKFELIPQVRRPVGGRPPVQAQRAGPGISPGTDANVRRELAAHAGRRPMRLASVMQKDPPILQCRQIV